MQSRTEKYHLCLEVNNHVSDSNRDIFASDHISLCTEGGPGEERWTTKMSIPQALSFADSTDSRITFFASLAELLLPFAHFFIGGHFCGVIGCPTNHGSDKVTPDFEHGVRRDLELVNSRPRESGSETYQQIEVPKPFTKRTASYLTRPCMQGELQ